MGELPADAARGLDDPDAAGFARCSPRMALANEAIWRTQPTETWVTLETFAFPAVLVAFLWLQIMALQRFLIEEGQAD
jgi:intracellular septation protein A